jgi:hypothetical protein
MLKVILWVVCWYLQFLISYRDLELMLRNRGVSVDHTTIYHWIQAYVPELERRLRPHLCPTNGSWRLDETYLKVKGRWVYLCTRRSTAAARSSTSGSAPGETLRPPSASSEKPWPAQIRSNHALLWSTRTALSQSRDRHEARQAALALLQAARRITRPPRSPRNWTATSSAVLGVELRLPGRGDGDRVGVVAAVIFRIARTAYVTFRRRHF